MPVAFGFCDVLVLGLMPTVAIGGPLALLGLLFPSACAGLALFVRRWRALLAVMSLNSTIYLIHGWFPASFANSYRESQFDLWLCMTIVPLIALVLGSNTGARARMPDLAFVSFLLVAASSGYLYCIVSGTDSALSFAAPALVNAIAVAVGFVYEVWTRRPSSPSVGEVTIEQPIASEQAESERVVLPIEGSNRIGEVDEPETAIRLCEPIFANTSPRLTSRAAWETSSIILVAMSLASSCVAGKIGFQLVSNEPLNLRWANALSAEGIVCSSPLINGEQVFATASLVEPASGALYCINSSTGETLWTFNDDGHMKPALSSPCCSTDRIYFGEGFHTDADCKLYCVSSTDGRKVWEFQTTSHIESSPALTESTIIFGAGDDGIYCLNAQTGAAIWHFTGCHVDGSPAISQDRVYAGSGYGSQDVFCLDAISGELIWRTPIDMSCFSGPAVSAECVFYGVGNGNLLGSVGRHSGALVCIDRNNGSVKWAFQTKDAVHSTPVIVDNHVIFGSRDHNCYCVNIHSGNLKWARDCRDPITAAPIATEVDQRGVVFVLTLSGHFSCLDVESGDLISNTATTSYVAARPFFISRPGCVVSGADHRVRHRFYFGAGSNEFGRKPVLFCLD